MAVRARKDELRRQLKARGLKTTGRKEELIDHVIKAKVDGTETIERGKCASTRAAEKLRSPSENLSDPKTLNNWTNDLSKLPQISSYKEIIDYLVYGSCKFFQSRENMKCFKQLKVFKFFKDRHLQKIELMRRAVTAS